MSALLERLAKFSAAEDFLAFFDIRHDERVVHVYRLHILKRFNQYLETHSTELADPDSEVRLGACRALLARAYGDFVRSTPAKEKVFKVFQDAQGAEVGFESLRRTLPSRRAS